MSLTLFRAVSCLTLRHYANNTKLFARRIEFRKCWKRFQSQPWVLSRTLRRELIYMALLTKSKLIKCVELVIYSLYNSVWDLHAKGAHTLPSAQIYDQSMECHLWKSGCCNERICIQKWLEISNKNQSFSQGKQRWFLFENFAEILCAEYGRDEEKPNKRHTYSSSRGYGMKILNWKTFTNN